MKKETEEWLKIATEDYQAAQCLFNESLYRMTCYHAQQAVEKTLKALLTEKEISFGRIHNVIDLKQALSDIGLEVPLNDEEATFLNSVYKSRYPLNLGLLPQGEPTKKDAEQAINIASKILDKKN